MSGKLQAEIKQSKPFPRLEDEAFVNLIRTADRLVSAQAQLMKPWDLSPTQYNVLRILRGAGHEGLCCGEVGERLITRDPDITRLLDRMESRGLVTRSRDRKDRRVIAVRITQAGLKLLEEMQPAVEEFARKHLGPLGAARLRTLIDLLEQARERAG
ncbi:MAG TPA: MarR family transcriptional regulator [Bryobacteraceae bacterium]|nr:MarR family transcriptional regulator [Bryobacteraceae bacterium]